MSVTRFLRLAISKLLLLLIVVTTVATIVFALAHLAPGDPLSYLGGSPAINTSLKQQWIAAEGLNRPVYEQYFSYVGSVLTGDFGWSYSTNQPVSSVILQAVPYTIGLTLSAVILAFIIGICVGVTQSTRKDSFYDRVMTGTTMILHSLPDFWLAILLLLGFAYYLPIFPIGGAHDPIMFEYMTSWGKLKNLAAHAVLPVITLTLILAATVARYQRDEMLRTLSSEYVRYARAAGIGQSRIIWHHALRNSLLPAITLFGFTLPVVFTGAVFVEKIYAWPGIGWTLLNAFSTRDYPLIIGGVIICSAAVVAGSQLADLLYKIADPRLIGGDESGELRLNSVDRLNASVRSGHNRSDNDKRSGNDPRSRTYIADHDLNNKA